ncbi:hypothetical protein BU16DRAFT_139191 [Lophium mytilinum]|uniref:Uncharacterized protein n=1 Tax=Lophium mytilinum TaxID=390894 RepID=A0A6A6QFZ0_9PEZI|nr:hypothetical protein BU16DRAFT_139191 [Lophium mytilinum]
MPALMEGSKYISFEGDKIDFHDGSKWEIQTPLSDTRLQETNPPFEAAVVYNCKRLSDPWSAHGDTEEAVIKIKYQIKGESRAIEYYRKNLARWQEDCGDCKDAFGIGQVNTAIEAYETARNPTKKPNRYTAQEIKALQLFRTCKSKSAPWFMA